MSQNTCPHNIIKEDPDTYEWYCKECGVVVEAPEDEEEAA